MDEVFRKMKIKYFSDLQKGLIAVAHAVGVVLKTGDKAKAGVKQVMKDLNLKP